MALQSNSCAELGADLDGMRVMVVEDMLLIAEVITDLLADCGCDVVGPASRVSKGVALAREQRLDGALLDVNLAGEYSFPIATVLAARDIPFIFLTGYGEAAVPAEHRAAPTLSKPFNNDELIRLMAAHLHRSAAAGH